MLFSNPEEHAANPPASWKVRKSGRKWQLCTQAGTVLHTAETKREAEGLKAAGFYFDLYNDETRWYRGEKVRNWKPYQPREAVTS